MNPAAADALYKRAWLLDFSGSYEADKKLLNNTYSKFGVGAGKGIITCEKVGDLYSDPLNMLSENNFSSSFRSDDDDGLALSSPLSGSSTTSNSFSTLSCSSFLRTAISLRTKIRIPHYL